MKILILGATSAIAQAYARRRALGCDFILAARREDRLAAVAADLKASGASSAEIFVADLAAMDRIEEAANDLRARFGAIDEAVVAYGVLGEQTAAEQDLAQARALIDNNFTSAALWVLALLKGRSENAPITIVGIGPVATPPWSPLGRCGCRGSYQRPTAHRRRSVSQVRRPRISTRFTQRPFEVPMA